MIGITKCSLNQIPSFLEIHLLYVNKVSIKLYYCKSWMSFVELDTDLLRKLIKILVLLLKSPYNIL